MNNPHRALPSVDTLLQACGEEVGAFGRQQVTELVRELLAQRRERISAGETVDTDLENIRLELRGRLDAAAASSLRTVFNLTGTVLHTNLGRALLPRVALDAVTRTAVAASNLEFDLVTGERGQRDAHIAEILCKLTGAEAATAVNNNAAAVLLVLNTLALAKEIPVSRGELVEIGGSFRIPEVMQRAGCRLVEVGATNRTHLKDYANAIGPDTAMLMKVHTSNYQVEGFTAAVEETALAELAHANDLPLCVDLGSGNLVDFEALGLPAEPTVAQALAQGVDLVTFSGDKLLGGPQCGFIVGRADLIARINANPLKRALRLDKMTLAAADAVLRLYRDPDSLMRELPTLRLLTRPESEIADVAERVLPAVAAALAEYSVEISTCKSQIGSGSLPVESLPSRALVIRATDGSDGPVRSLAQALRQLPRPVIGRISQSALWLDMRCLEEEAEFLAQLEMLAL